MSVINFPGTVGQEKEEEPTVKQILDGVAGEELKEVFVIGVKETGQIILSGNCTMAAGVYFAEVAKSMLIVGDGDDE